MPTMRQKINFEQYVPAAAVTYCQHLYNENIFQFVVTRPRRTRLGDFTVKPGFMPRVTVNINLNPYNFLITYLHEVAHYQVHKKYTKPGKKRVQPHGTEWKNEFRALLTPVLTLAFFPEEVLAPLKKYAINPKASTGADIALYSAVKRFDNIGDRTNKTELIQLIEGADFVFQNRRFVRGAVRRTRVLCVDKVSMRKYTIPAHALVEAC